MKIFFVISLLVCTHFCCGQVIEFGKDGTLSNNWHERVIVLNIGKEKEGLIKYENAISKMYGMKMISKIRFKANEDAKKEKYKKKAVDYFILVNHKGDLEKYSYERLTKHNHLLLRVLGEGKINLYS